MHRKTITITLPSEDSQEEFITTLLDKAALHSILIKRKGRKLFITISGTYSEIKMVQALIKELVKDILSREGVRRGLKVFSEKDIIRLIRRTVSLEVLCIVLKELGYETKYNEVEKTIETNAQEEIVRSTAERIVKAIDELKFKTTSTSVKRYLSVLYAITGIDLEDIIARSLDLGLLKEENNKLYMNKEWRNAVKEYLKYIRQS